ncbi:transcription termination factor NusA [Facilibium subflavum]|uniref:transcription termination factor NusA n=1 Tax=Facilibium subflavum TaxID=2219058 RepID=UPI000E65454B|nr:transcription termination factor NusA [Facilibium subflavum]
MSKELLLVIETVANEKEVSKEILFEAMEEALAMATKKRFNEDVKIRVSIDRKTGEYDTFRQWEIVDEDHFIENYAAELYVDVAREKGHDVNVGDILEEPLESIEFGRIAAMTAKQVIMQKVREEEKRLMVERFTDKVGKIVYGEVKRVTRDFIVVDLGNDAEGVLYRSELLPKENYRMNDKLRACVLKIDAEAKGYQILLSRASNSMLRALLELEVPEVAEELMDIMNIARDPGSRAKVAVKSNDKRIDPVGACVGMRGSRIQAITNELQGERIDIVLWDENPAQYVINSLSPAEVVSIVMDEDTQTMEVAVKEDQLSQAIGKSGQNVRLATALTGWHVNVMAESVAAEKQAQESQKVMQTFVESLDIDEDIAEALVEEGFATLEEVAYVEPSEMLEIEGFDQEVVAELQERAKTALLSKALSGPEPAEDLLAMDGMTKEWAKKLAQNGVVCMEDLAELATDDLIELIPMDEKKAASLIMTARAPWFEGNKGQ